MTVHMNGGPIERHIKDAFRNVIIRTIIHQAALEHRKGKHLLKGKINLILKISAFQFLSEMPKTC